MDRHGLTGVADAGAFLARLVRLDRSALVRMEPDGADRTVLWSWLPWQVLVNRTVAGRAPAVTVLAAELLAGLERGGVDLPARRDERWRGALPPGPGRVVETIASGEVRQIAVAAATTLRGATGARRVGERMVRDALLDHVPIVVTDVDDGRIEVPQRLVQGVLRMGFLGPAGPAEQGRVQIRVAGRWIGISAQYGIAWLRQVSELRLQPGRVHTNG